MKTQQALPMGGAGNRATDNVQWCSGHPNTTYQYCSLGQHGCAAQTAAHTTTITTYFDRSTLGQHCPCNRPPAGSDRVWRDLSEHTPTGLAMTGDRRPIHATILSLSYLVICTRCDLILLFSLWPRQSLLILVPCQVP